MHSPPQLGEPQPQPSASWRFSRCALDVERTSLRRVDTIFFGSSVSNKRKWHVLLGSPFLPLTNLYEVDRSCESHTSRTRTHILMGTSTQGVNHLFVQRVSFPSHQPDYKALTSGNARTSNTATRDSLLPCYLKGEERMPKNRITSFGCMRLTGLRPPPAQRSLPRSVRVLAGPLLFGWLLLREIARSHCARHQERACGV